MINLSCVLIFLIAAYLVIVCIISSWKAHKDYDDGSDLLSQVKGLDKFLNICRWTFIALVAVLAIGVVCLIVAAFAIVPEIAADVAVTSFGKAKSNVKKAWGKVNKYIGWISWIIAAATFATSFIIGIFTVKYLSAIRKVVENNPTSPQLTAGLKIEKSLNFMAVTMLNAAALLAVVMFYEIWEWLYEINTGKNSKKNSLKVNLSELGGVSIGKDSDSW